MQRRSARRRLYSKAVPVNDLTLFLRSSWPSIPIKATSTDLHLLNMSKLPRQSKSTNAHRCGRSKKAKTAEFILLSQPTTTPLSPTPTFHFPLSLTARSPARTSDNPYSKLCCPRRARKTCCDHTSPEAILASASPVDPGC